MLAIPEAGRTMIAVALLVFNRPELTRRLLSVVRSVRPAKLYVVADGPRADRPGDASACAAVRELIRTHVDWPCELHQDYADSNLGCGRRVSSGIAWVLAQENEAIFLEDDCLPHPTFFSFCKELLRRYRDDERVAQICGSRIVAERPGPSASYSFSRYGPVWGWATWRRAWSGYDFELRDWPMRRDSGWLYHASVTRREADMRLRLYDDLHAGRIDTWDYQWGYAKLVRGQLSVIPAVNLVDNVGFGPEATHRQLDTAAGAARAMSWPLVEPAGVEIDLDYDRAFSRHIAPSLASRLGRRLRSCLHR